MVPSGCDVWALGGHRIRDHTGLVTKEPSPKQARVLVASGSSWLRQLIGCTLRQDPRFKVVAEVSDGDETVSFADSYDLAVVDLRLPGLGVLGVVSQLRQHHPERSVVVLAPTGAVYLRYASLQEGAGDYLVVPDELDQLPDRLNAVARAEAPVPI